MKRNRPSDMVALDEEDEPTSTAWHDASPDEPFMAVVRGDERTQVNQALAQLPVAFREVLVLRELEDLSYREIATIAEVPVGTVMSRLSRARSLMREALTPGARPALRAVAGTGGKQ